MLFFLISGYGQVREEQAGGDVALAGAGPDGGENGGGDEAGPSGPGGDGDRSGGRKVFRRPARGLTKGSGRFLI